MVILPTTSPRGREPPKDGTQKGRGGRSKKIRSLPIPGAGQPRLWRLQVLRFWIDYQPRFPSAFPAKPGLTRADPPSTARSPGRKAQIGFASGSRERYGWVGRGFAFIPRSHNRADAEAGGKIMVLRADEPSEGALRKREWRARRRASWRQRCACCGVVFVPARSDARYCGAACAQRAYRRRKSGGDAPSRPTAAWRASGPAGPSGGTGPRPEAARSPLRAV